MQIDAVNRSWQTLTNHINRLLVGAKNIRSFARPNRAKKAKREKFSGWSRACIQTTAKPNSGARHATVDVNALLQFVQHVFPADQSYHLLMSSPLPPSTWQSGQDIKKALALRNLVDLLRTTTGDMKMIERHYVSQSKV